MTTDAKGKRPLYSDADGNYARAIEYLEEHAPELAKQLTLERLNIIQMLYATRDDAYHCGYVDCMTAYAVNHSGEQLVGVRGVLLKDAIREVKNTYNYYPRVAGLEPEGSEAK